MKEKIKNHILVILMYTTVFLTGVSGSYLYRFMQQEKEYILYIGLNDKDTYEPRITTEEAKELVSAICTQYADGYTLLEAEGAWVDEKEILTNENTLVYFFRGADRSAVDRIMDEVIKNLNQNAIILEERSSSYTFYYGKQEYGDYYDKNRE